MAKNSPDEGKSTKMVEKQVDPSFNNLKEYRAKRQFSETPEPMADTVETPSRIPVFVVQKHEASHFHFDFRLEVGIMNMTGVFAGAAVTQLLGKWTDGGSLGEGFAMLSIVVALALGLQIYFLRPKTDNME